MKKDKLDKIKEIYRKISTPEEQIVDLLEQISKEKLKGDKGETPIKGQDYFTDDEIKEFIDATTPKKGEHYFDGHTPTEDEIIAYIKPLIPSAIPGKDGSQITPEEVRDKLMQLKGKDKLSILELKDLEWLKSKEGMEWSSAGFKIYTDSSLTGDGSFSNPLKATAVSENYKDKVSATDTTPDYLISKLVAGTGITLTKQNTGGNENIKIDGASTYTLPTASASVLGGVKIGARLTMTGDTLSADVQSGFTNPMTTLGDLIYENATPIADRLAGNITTVQKFLSQTGDGVNSAAPSWETVPTQGTIEYYLHSTDSAVSGDKQLFTTPQVAKVQLDYTPANGTHLLQTWISEAGFPNLTFIPAGGFEFHIHAKRTSGAFTVYAEFWETDASGADIGIIGTSGSSATTTSEVEYRLFFYNANTYTFTSSASRIAVKVYGTTTGSPMTATLYVGGTADSHIILPSNTVDAINFVPYTGATANVDLGAHTLTATSVVETTPTLLKLDQTTPQTISNGQPIQDTLTASQIVATDVNKKLQTLAVATYPSLTEISYVKGVTSAIQTQLNSKQASGSYEVTTNKATTFGTINDTFYPTVKAVNDAIVSAVVGLLDYRGSYDASGNTYPTTGGSGLIGAILKGDFWIISVAGTLGGNAVYVGDMVTALQDTPGQTAGNWDVIEYGLSYVPENVTNKVTSISGTSTDTQYPSAKLVYNQLAGKQATLVSATNIKTVGGTTLLGSGDVPFPIVNDSYNILANQIFS